MLRSRSENCHECTKVHLSSLLHNHSYKLSVLILFNKTEVECKLLCNLTIIEKEAKAKPVVFCILLISWRVLQNCKLYNWYSVTLHDSHSSLQDIVFFESTVFSSSEKNMYFSAYSTLMAQGQGFRLETAESLELSSSQNKQKPSGFTRK